MLGGEDKPISLKPPYQCRDAACVRPLVKLVGCKYGQDKSEKRSLTERLNARCHSQAEERPLKSEGRNQTEAIAAVHLKKTMPGDAFRVAVVLPKGSDQQRTQKGSVFLVKSVPEPMHRSRGQVRQNVPE